MERINKKNKSTVGGTTHVYTEISFYLFSGAGSGKQWPNGHGPGFEHQDKCKRIFSGKRNAVSDR